MATYYHDSSSSEIQAADGGIQTVYLIHPNYMPNNYNSDTLLLPHGPPPNQDQPLVGIPLPSPSINVSQITTSENNTNMNLNRSLCPQCVYSAGSDGQDLTQSQPHGNPLAALNSHNQIGYLRHAQGGLSLSLSSQAATYSSSRSVSANVFDTQTRGNTTPSVGTLGVRSVVLGSKYLRAAQEILDEVVNVGDDVMNRHEKGIKEKLKMMSKESKDVNGESSNLGENSEAELTAGQRQELQIKKSKLVTMLDEVEQRYRQYHHQMQMVVCSFEQAAGFASANTYTARALRTISKQFRCLKDAIFSQIKSTCKKLGEEAASSSLGAKIESSRLRYVDHQLRQQQALQQMGMVQQPNAWRPQRGLPERAVSVLRAWLFEHFLHPYPKDSDKHMLAKQTGLTKSQVSNWFINARVRLWKPMVEEMYLEEMKEHQRKDDSDENTNGSGSQNNKNIESESTTTIPNPVLVDTADKLKNQQVVTSPTNDTQLSNSSMSAAMRINFHHQTCFNLIGSSSSSDIVQRSSKKPRNDTYMEMEQKGERLNDGGGYRLIGNNIDEGFIDTFTVDTVEDIGRFNSGSHDLPAAARFHGNGVSLTLGLQHCGDNNITISGTQQNFVSTQEINHLGRRGLKLSSSTEPGYGNIESTQNTNRFATQLMPDFMT